MRTIYTQEGYGTTNNPDAPRYRREEYDIISRDFIKRLKKKYPELKGWHERDIRRTIKEFHEEAVIQHVLNNREPLELPAHIGRLFVGVYGKEPVIDRGFSLEIGKKLHHRSACTDGYGSTFYYIGSDKYPKHLAAKDMWSYIPTTNAKQGLSEKMQDGTTWKIYMYMRNRKYVHEGIRRAKIRMSHTTYKREEFNNYNELDITED